MKKISKEPKLTMKQRRFLQEYFKTGNGTKSAMAAYDTEDYQTAAAIASQNLKKLKPSIQTLMEAKNISLGRLLEVLDTSLEATRTTETGKEEADTPNRLKAVQIASKWLGLEQNNQVNIQVNNVQPENFYEED